MGPLSSPGYLLPPLAVSLAAILLIAVVWFWTSRRFADRLFLGLLLTVALWSLNLFGMRGSVDESQALWWMRLGPLLFHSTFVLYYHFALVHSGARSRRGVLIVLYGSLAVVAALVPTGLLIEGVRSEYYGYAPDTTIGGTMLGLLDVVLMGGGAFHLLRRRRVSRSHDERTRCLLLAIGPLFPMAGAFIDGLTNLPPVFIWANLAFTSICTVAVVSYRLLDIRVALRRALAYIMLSIMVAVPYVAALLGVSQLLNTTITSWWTHTLIIVVLAIILRPLYDWAQRLVDRLFYRDRYDYLRALEEFSSQARSVADVYAWVPRMLELVRGALRSSGACLLLPVEDGLVVAASVGLQPLTAARAAADGSPSIRSPDGQSSTGSSRFQNEPEPRNTVESGLSDVVVHGAEPHVPFRTREGNLSGILVLGAKLSQQPYSVEDWQVLATVTGQLAMALENARLYEGGQNELAARKRAESELRKARDNLEARVDERTIELTRANTALAHEMTQRVQAEEALTKSEARYRRLVEVADSIVMQLDALGRVTFLNRFAQELFGFPPSQIVGLGLIGAVLPHTDFAGNDLECVVNDILRHPDEHRTMEMDGVRRDGERVWISWTFQPLHDDDGTLHGILVTGSDRTEQRRTEYRMAEELREETAAAERSRLARDLHDAVSQTLFSASMIAEVLPQLWVRDQSEGRERLEELRQITRGARDEMRTLLYELRPAALADSRLEELLQQLAHAVRARVDLPVSLEMEGRSDPSPEAKRALYRIAQEALNNVARHAEADEASVRLRCAPGRIELKIRDDGVGFDALSPRRDGMGLRIMQERAQAAGASLEIVSVPGRGTEIVAICLGETVREEQA